MSINRTGKLVVFLILAVLTVSGVSATISNVEIDPLSSQYEKGSSITVTGEVYGSQIDEVTLQRETSYGGSTTVGTDSGFNDCPNGCKVEIDYTFENEGSQELFLRAASGDQRKNSNTENIEVITSSPGSADFELKDVKTTDYNIYDGESTYLQAVVKNTGDSGDSVLVRWYGGATSLAKKWQYIPPGEKETLQASELTWQNLQDKGLELDKDYNLEGKMRYGGETVDTRTAGNKLRVHSIDRESTLTVNTEDANGNELDNVDVTVNGRTKDSGNNARVRFTLESGSYTITAEKNNYQAVERGVYLSPGEEQEETLQLSREPEKARLTVHTGKINRQGPKNVDVTVDGRTKGTGSDDRVRFDLDAGSYTVTASANGKYADKDVELDNGERETIHLGLPADSDRDDGDATLTVNTRDGDGDKLRYVDVSVDGEEYDSDNSGSSATSTFHLESGSYTIEAEKEGYETATKGVYLSPGEEQEETLYLDRKSTYRNCDLSVNRVSIDDHTLSSGDSTDVSLKISSDREQDFKVLIESEEGTYYKKQITVDGTRTITKSVTPDNDVKIYTKVEAVNGPCRYEKWESSDEIIVADTYDEDEYELTVDVEDEDGDNIENARVELSNGVDFVDQTGSNGKAYFSLENGDYDLKVEKEGYNDEERDFSIDGSDRTIDVTLEEDDDDDSKGGTGRFTARVVDQDNNRLEDARVRVENGDNSIKWTDDDGEAEFELEDNNYRVAVWKNGYGNKFKDIEIEDGDDITEGFKLYREKDIEISDFNHPSSVCRGSSVSISFRVSNTGNSREVIDTEGSGLGTGTPSNSVVLNAGESKRVSLIFTGVQGGGSESFTVTASNGETASASRTVNVQSCGVAGGGTARDISLSINPDRTLSNQPVKVKGYVDGARGRSEVKIKVDGNQVGKVSTQPDGYFQSYIRVEEVGEHSISVETDSISANRELKVLPTASVNLVNPPQEVFEGEEFEICANVDSQITPEVLLLRDGVVMQSEKAKGQVCFTPTAKNPGEHIYTVRALTSGQGSEATAKIRVLETAPEASSFPEQLASVESESGLVKAELYNTHDELKRYNVGLEGLPDGWVSTSEKEVILSKGERKTIYFYVMPKEEGSYSGDIVIESQGSEIYRENVTVWAGGTTEKASKSWFSKFSGFWPF